MRGGEISRSRGETLAFKPVARVFAGGMSDEGAQATANAGLEVEEGSMGEIDFERTARAIACDAVAIGDPWIVAKKRRDLAHEL